MSLTNSDLTWRFELRLFGEESWVPITTAMADDALAEDAGPHEMPNIWQDAAEAAPEELERALADLVAVGDPLGMSGARIVLWEDLSADGDPAYVLEATAAQLAMGRLERANHQVQWALRQVDHARTQVRAEIIRAAVENRLTRNTIARLTSGALTRRLVLQLLAGYDLIEGIRDALPSRSKQYRRWDPHIATDAENYEYLGPFCYGPIQLDLEPSGQVYLSLIDLDGPRELDMADDDYDEEDERANLQARAERARGYAEEALPLLTRAGFVLLQPDGTAASLDDLARTIAGTRLSVSNG